MIKNKYTEAIKDLAKANISIKNSSIYSIYLLIYQYYIQNFNTIAILYIFKLKTSFQTRLLDNLILIIDINKNNEFDKSISSSKNIKNC